jgi:putative membrane protein
MGTTGTAGEQGATAGAAGSTGSASMGDKHFVKEATEGSNAEIALGKLAQEKSNSADVKQFGERMVTDHSKLNDQMAPVAQQMGITPNPDQIPAKDKALEKKLQGLSGEQFDKAYIQAMLKDHTEDVKKFKKEAASAKDPTLQQNVQQGLQVIQEHLQMAQQLAQAHNVNTGGAQTSSTATP